MGLREMAAEIPPECECGEEINQYQAVYLDEVASLRPWSRKCSECRPEHIQRAVDRYFARGVP